MLQAPSQDTSMTSKFFGRGNQSGLSTSALDYTATRFHTTLTGRNDTTLVINETLQAQAEQKAFEKAREATFQKGIEQAQKETKRLLNEQKAKERGSKAIQSVLVEKDKKIFEQEMRKAHIAEEMHKIEEVRKNPDAADTGPNNCGKTVMAQQKEKRMQ